MPRERMKRVLIRSLGSIKRLLDNASVARTRDLARSRERILQAALEEFAARGLHGGRTRSIARRARLSEQMLFHCFGSKERLYREVVERQLHRVGGALESGGRFDLATHLIAGFERALDEDRGSLRLWQWEALERGGQTLAAEDARRRLFDAECAELRRQKDSGLFPADLDERDMLLATLGLRLVPALLPQLSSLIFGLSNDEPEFRSRWAGFLRKLSALLAQHA